MEPMERLALSWGNTRQFTKLLLSLLSHIGVNNGLPSRSSMVKARKARLRFASTRQPRSCYAASEGWWVATVPPRALRFKRPLHRCNACNPVRDAKAELNRRGQACEVLAGTGIRVAENGQSDG